MTDTLKALANFGPELALCGTIVAMLLLRVLFGRREAPMLATLVIAAGAAVTGWFLLPVPEGRATVALWTFVIGVGAMLVLRAVALVGSFALGTRGGALSSPSNVVLMLGLAVGLALAIHDTWGACCGGVPGSIESSRLSFSSASGACSHHQTAAPAPAASTASATSTDSSASARQRSKAPPRRMQVPLAGSGFVAGRGGLP